MSYSLNLDFARDIMFLLSFYLASLETSIVDKANSLIIRSL